MHSIPCTTIQVTPLELTTKLMDAAVRGGATLVKGRVQGVRLEEGNRLTGLVVDGQTMPADKVNLGRKENRVYPGPSRLCVPWAPGQHWWRTGFLE